MHTYIPVHQPTCILDNMQHNTQSTPLNNMNTEASLNNQRLQNRQIQMRSPEQFSPFGIFERGCSTRSGLNSRSCCLDKSHQSRGVQGQSDPPRNRKFFYFTLEMVSQTTVLSRGAKSRLASSKLNQVWLKSQDVMSGQDSCGGYYDRSLQGK